MADITQQDKDLSVLGSTVEHLTKEISGLESKASHIRIKPKGAYEGQQDLRLHEVENPNLTFIVCICLLVLRHNIFPCVLIT